MELILHIGTGKTGSTSIQSLLKSHEKDVMAHGVFFSGYMFDLLSDKPFSWQKNAGTEVFNQLPAEQRKHELEAVLDAAKREAVEKNCTKIIWSNEALCNMPHVASIIESVWDDDVSIIAYLRRNDDYAVSAYKQWGLKHKIHKGELLSFPDFTKVFPVTFHDRLIKWQRKDWQFHLFNYHNCPNVVEHFLAHVSLPLNVEQTSTRKNSDNTLAFLLLKALVNTAEDIPPLEQSFPIDENMTIRDADWFFGKLPTAKDVLEIFESTEDDRQKLNTLLPESQQFNEIPPVFTPYTVKQVKVAYSIVMSLLADKVIKNDEKWKKQYATNSSTAKFKGKVNAHQAHIDVLAKHINRLDASLDRQHHLLSKVDVELSNLRAQLAQSRELTKQLQNYNDYLKSEVHTLHKELVAHNDILSLLTKQSLIKRVVNKVKRMFKIHQ